MRVTRSLAVAVVTGAVVFGSAGIASAGQDSGIPHGDGGVVVQGKDDRDPVDRGEDPGEPAGGEDGLGGGDDRRGRGDGGHERRGGDSDRPLCEDDRMHRGELAIDPDRARGASGWDEADWDLGDGRLGGKQGWFSHWTHCVETPPAPDNPGQPPKSEPDADVHAGPDDDGGDDGSESESGSDSDTDSGPEVERTERPESHVDGAPAEPTRDATADRHPQDPAGGHSVNHDASSAAPAPSMQRADAGPDDDGAAAAASGSDDGEMGLGGALLLIGGGGLLAAAAATLLAARTRRA
ncbi:hypothetical protein [Prauserella alba]|uniref:Uncharacterized protein n=1 Tax=Prauserella alba TaxID=176898 RepID=A0ABP4G6C3_9PSEU|nr:hypothetical protein [Prauserella alba]MCP2181042.1 hypothetical protein [Prauserella alba]